MNRHELLQGVEDVLAQGLALLAGVDELTYATPLAEPFHASIGGHYRHVLDHFACVLDGIRTGTIDYDQRSRNRSLEADLEYARAATTMLIDSFRATPAETWLRSCAVTYSVAYSARPATLTSTFAREAAFSVGHAVHHFAIIRLLCAQWSVEVPAEFGVAPSTLKHRAQAASQA